MRKRAVRLGDVEVDCRFPVIFSMASGHGKKNLETVIVKACNDMGDYVARPTSLHPEQLIGKTVRIERRGKVFYRKVYGHLADDIVIFDEGRNLISAKELIYQEDRRFLSIALDPIGSNEVSKRMVDVPREHTLTYSPDCTVVIFLQPFPLEEEAVLSGFFRRFLVLSLPFKNELRETEFILRTQGTHKRNLHEFSNYLGEIREFSEGCEIALSEEAKARFDALHIELVRFGKEYSYKIGCYTQIIAYTLQNLLLKMSAILAMSQKRNTVTERDLELAFCDLLEFLTGMFDFLTKKVQGTFDYGETWQGATGEDRTLLQWLAERGCLSLETSNISISDYQRKVVGIIGRSDGTARKIYRKHRLRGWIASKQTGKNTTKV